jgi:predicted Zn-dependent protease
MKKLSFISKILSILCLMAIVYSCKQVPLTGRRQINFLPSSQMLALSTSSYQQTLSQAKVVRGTAEANKVNEVGQNIRRAVEAYMRQNNMSDQLQNFEWEFSLIDENTINAWAMPGGKVAIYTGILPVTQNDDGLATVMGHEVAHAVARHGNERMSQGLATQLGGMGLQAALSSRPQQTQQIFNTAFGIGSQVGVMLPFSRLHESEADRLGVIFMQMAGYNPEAAIPFWERMSQQSKGGSPPEFLSTHPAPATRVRNLRKYINEAKQYQVVTNR